jgi:hypothetical protein
LDDNATENWIFVTFADGNPEFVDAGKRIARQAESLNIFSEVRVLDGNSLSDISSVYRTRFRSTAINKRGFGYWVWKPLLFQSLIQEISKQDKSVNGIFYADAGCEIPVNFFSRRNFKKLLSESNKTAIIADSTSRLEIQYSKGVTFEYLDPDYNFAFTNQIAATWLAVRLNEAGISFVDDWVKFATQNDGLLVNDNFGNEHPEFIDHRHDQSILSLLFKTNGYQPYHIHFHNRLGSIRNSMQPIWTWHNRSNISLLKGAVNRNLFPFLGILLNKFVAVFCSNNRLRKNGR